MAGQTTKSRALTTTEKRAKAMADPKRARILRHLVEVGVKAPSEIANELEMPLNNVSYHCAQLVKYECVELAKTEFTGGSLKHWYRPIELHYISAADYEGMEEWRKPSIVVDAMRPVIDDFNSALTDATFTDDGRWHLMRNPLKSIDQQGLDELLEAHMALYEKSNEIQRRAAERLAESGEEAIRISSSSQCFQVGSFAGRDIAF